MSARGIKFNFTTGEVVLCFEPDPTKARVLYEAKILEATVTRDEEGKKQPGYHIHFQGWNNSWDRVVSECFVLKNTEENRDLMRQLADIAKRVRRNRTRKKKINDVLGKAFNGKPPPFESESEGSEEEDDEDAVTTDATDTDDGEVVGESTDESGQGSVKSEDNKRKKQNVDLEIPDTLKRVLDKDFFAVNSDNKLVKLPAEINVVTVLESFVKTFMLDFWSATFDRAHFCHTAPKLSIDRVLPMCKEFVDGLRICFDFTLPLILLYPAERRQYDSITVAYKHKSPAKSKVHAAEENPLIQSPRLRSASRRSMSEDEPSPKLPKLSPKVLCDEEEDNEVTFLHRQDVLPPRRVTRQTAHDTSSTKKSEKQTGSSVSNPAGQESRTSERKQSASHGSAIKSRRVSDRQAEASSSRRKDLRKSRKPSGGSSESGQSKTETVQSEPTKTPVSQKGERPPPLLIPCNILSTRQNGHGPSQEKGAPGSTDSLGDSGREEVLDNVLAWQMLPPEIQTKLPTPPSLLYGAQHLTRLFVKLPELLSRMEMEENKMGVLVKIINQFLLYLSEHLVELFPETAYVSASEAY